MTRATKLRIAGKTAIIAALMGGSSLSFAQDAAPTVAAPVQQPSPAAIATEPVTAPPPVVSTLPTENDVVNPAAAQEAAAESATKRQATMPTKAITKTRATDPVKPIAPVPAAPTSAIAPDAVTEASSNIVAPPLNAVEPVGTTAQGSAAIAPVGDAIAVPVDGISNEDITLVGGIAAALAAIGVGAAFASRRRRAAVATDRNAVVSEPEYAAPRPIRDDPAFQQFANAAPERIIQPAPVMTRPDIAVTDPLFSTPVIAGPITDPLFAPRNDVQPPISDPLFAKHGRFVGRTQTARAVTREPELVR